jgi:hypothetical protein
MEAEAQPFMGSSPHLIHLQNGVVAVKADKPSKRTAQ